MELFNRPRNHFGYVALSREQETFRNELNREIISLCQSMPASTQAETFLFIINYFRSSINDSFNFFKYFYAPAWSVIYWVIKSFHRGKTLLEKSIKDAKAAHSMAMLLHPLDDDLHDNDLQATHLLLLLRSQAWLIMNNALDSLAETVEKGDQVVRDCIDRYYSSVYGSRVIDSLDSYCARFKCEMATWLVVPELLIRKRGITNEAAAAILSGYESFGIAWRLLDDINDLETDIEKGVQSSIYFALPDQGRRIWERNSEDCGDISRNSILEVIYQTGAIDIVRERICRELESAACVTSTGSYPIEGLADEYRSLLRPLKRL
jgi:hypothetical protein